jgi:hypothetical protein
MYMIWVALIKRYQRSYAFDNKTRPTRHTTQHKTKPRQNKARPDKTRQPQGKTATRQDNHKTRLDQTRQHKID